MNTTKLFLIILSTIFLSSACIANAKIEEPFTLKKNESKNIGEFTVKMLSVGHTIEQKGYSIYANLEISGKGKVEKPTLKVGEAIQLGDKFLKLEAVSETADPKFTDPFAATSCTLNVKIENPNKKTDQAATPTVTPTTTPTTTPTPIISKIKPTLVKVKNAKIRLGFGKKSAVIDLDETSDVTLGGESNHRFKLYFAIAKDDKVYYLFEVQSGSPMSDRNAPCGGDSPQTLVWLKTDFNLKVEAANSEVFASCAYNGGRYLQGKVKLTSNNLKVIFEEGMKKSEISYDNTKPENGFEIKVLNK